MQNSIMFLISETNYMEKGFFLEVTALIAIGITINDYLIKSSAEVVARVRRIAKAFMLTVLMATSINAMESSDAIYDFWVVLICTWFILYDYWIRFRKESVSLWTITIQALKVIKTKFVNNIRYNKRIYLVLCLIICIWIVIRITRSYFVKIVLTILKFLINNVMWLTIVFLIIKVINYIDTTFWQKILKNFLLIFISFIQSTSCIDWKMGCMLVPLITAMVLVIDTLIKHLIFKILKEHLNEKERQEEKQKILLIRELMSTVVIPGLVDISSGNTVLFFTIWSGCIIAFTYWYEL